MSEQALALAPDLIGALNDRGIINRKACAALVG